MTKLEEPSDAMLPEWTYGGEKDYETKFGIPVVPERDTFLLPSSVATLLGNYTLAGEGPQDVFMRAADYYGGTKDRAGRIYDYISTGRFMPATPPLSNAGGLRGLPISCFLNEAEDSMEDILATWNENVHLARMGGGIGSYWGKVRSIGESIGRNGRTSGVIPFIRVVDSLTMAISQGSLRRGSAAVYLPIWHPEIEEFIEIRRPTGGDPARKVSNLHHGVIVDDAFVRAVERDGEWELRSPVDGAVIRKVNARGLMIRLLLARMEQGEPYIIYGDAVNRGRPESYRRHNLLVTTSNLCAEIHLTTGPDHRGVKRTGVCCLSSLNLLHWDDIKDDEQFFEDVFYFLDNTLQDFIDRAPSTMANAVYAARRERSVGLGVMGFHSLLQARGIPFESAEARVLNRRIFKRIREMADRASRRIAIERGPCEDYAELGIMERFTHKLAIAPTASISTINSGASPGIEPISANVYMQKTLHGNFVVRNQELEKLLTRMGRNTPQVWNSITQSKGSVQHLDFLSEHEKSVFKTAFEIDQRSVVDLAADRVPFVCQGQATNLFLRADCHKRDLLAIHLRAWARGLKALYYCRSLSIQRAENVSAKVEVVDIMADEAPQTAADRLPSLSMEPIHQLNEVAETNYEECLACQ